MSDMPINQQSPPPATNRRAACVLVLIMTALLVLALLATVWGFIRQAHIYMAAKTTENAQPAAGTSALPAAIVTLAPGARIVSATTEAGKLVLHIDTPSGGEVEIIDLATGKQTGQVKTAP